MQKENNMDNILRSLNYTLDCASQRVRWYTETNENRYLVDCEMYLRVANIYMNELNEKKNEITC